MNLLVLPASFAQSATSTVPLQPIGQWHVEYADNSCHIARRFGTPENPVTLSMRVMPGRSANQFSIEQAIVGKDVFKRGPLKITTTPAAEPINVTATSGSIKEASRVTYAALGSDDLLKVEQSEQVAIAYDGETIVLGMRGIKSALAAAVTCEDDLLTSWGIDAVAYRNIAVQAKPDTSPANWLSNDDYPSQSLAEGERGAVSIRLDIADTGKVTNCSVLVSSGFKRLDDQTCQVVMKRARYEPARSKEGAAIASLSLLTFRWLVWP